MGAVGLLTLDGIGPNAEVIAMGAGKATGIAVGWDSEFECATFDSTSLDGEDLEATVFDALAGVDPDWASHLRLSE